MTFSTSTPMSVTESLQKWTRELRGRIFVRYSLIAGLILSLLTIIIRQSYETGSSTANSKSTETVGKWSKLANERASWREKIHNMGEAQLEEEFYRYVSSLHVDCLRRMRCGALWDGGYEVCEDGKLKPKQPCSVYSFGINNVWGFENEIVAKYGCMVHAFDPSMNMTSGLRFKKVYFHNFGLAGNNGLTPEGWRVFTLGTIRRRLKHEKTVVDIVRFDIEFFEWEALNKAYTEGALDNVKQVIFELHTPMMRTVRGSGKVKHDRNFFIHMYATLRKLEELGFRLYWSAANTADRHISPFTNKTRFCCIELSWYNQNFK